MKINSKSSKSVASSKMTEITPMERVDKSTLDWGIHHAKFIGQTIRDTNEGVFAMLHFEVEGKAYAIFSGHVKFSSQDKRNATKIGDEMLLVTCWGKKANGSPCMFYAVHAD